MSDSGALLRFVQRPNRVDLREGEAALIAKGRYSELVALYQRRNCHEQALDLLHTLSQAPHQLAVLPKGNLTHSAGSLLPATDQPMRQVSPSHAHLVIDCKYLM